MLPSQAADKIAKGRVIRNRRVVSHGYGVADALMQGGEESLLAGLIPVLRAGVDGVQKLGAAEKYRGVAGQGRSRKGFAPVVGLLSAVPAATGRGYSARPVAL